MSGQIDSKLRSCDVVSLKVEDIAPHGYAMERASARQKKTGRPVRFEFTDQARQSVDEYLRLTQRQPAASCSAAAAARSGASPRFSAGSRTSLKASSFLSCRPDRSRNCRSRSWLLDGKSLVRPRMKDPWLREIVGGAEADKHGGREAQSASRIRPRSPLGHIRA
jgi:hypothetical protein